MRESPSRRRLFKVHSKAFPPPWRCSPGGTDLVSERLVGGCLCAHVRHVAANIGHQGDVHCLPSMTRTLKALSTMLKGLLSQRAGTKLHMFSRAHASRISNVASTLLAPPLLEEGMSTSGVLSRFLTNHQPYILTNTLTDAGCIMIEFDAKYGMCSLISTPFVSG